ncbi:MAG: hypothetical protein F6K10_04910 [Moorea sp. SIO2B7]|nr:hypothetical protein [Moorena sp. SIO2B7]
MTILSEVQSLDIEAPVDLFKIYSERIAPFHFTNIAGVSFGGVLYQAIPCQFDWLSITGDGAIPSTRLVVSDASGLISGLIESHGGMVGARLEAIQTWRLFLDGQAAQDSTQFRGPLKLRINQQTWTPMEQIEFDCISNFDIERLTVPARSFLRRCQWTLGDENCRAPDNVHFDLAGNPTTSDRRACGKDLASCRRYHGHVKFFGGFPGIQRYS